MAIIRSQESTTPDPRPPVDAAMSVVKSAERVSVTELPDGGITFNVEPGRRDVWKVPVLCLVIGVIGLAAGYLLQDRNPGLPQGFTWRGSGKLMILGALNVALAPMVLLILLMQGPPKKVTLEARPGSLRADRYIAGDHVVSNYSADEVEYLFAEDTTLFATTRKGDQQLIASGDRDVNRAVATLLASRLWQGQETARGDAKGLGRWVILPRSRLGPAKAGAAG